MVLATIGSLGDLHPFIALGRALQARGADVVLAGAADYQSKVEAAGVVFVPVRPSFGDMEKASGLNREQLTRRVLERSDFLFRQLIVPSVRMSYEDMLPIVKGADLVLTSSLCFGGRLACERSGVPWIGVVLQPMMFLSAFDPPVIPKAEWLGPLFRHFGPTATAGVLRLLKLATHGLVGPVHALRREIGLPSNHHSPLFDGQFGADGAIGLYSSVLGGIQADYPRPTSIVGFTSFDSGDGSASRLEPDLLEFLQGGAAPVVFTLGSVVVNSPGLFYRESAAAARLLGKRAVLLVGESALPAHLDLRSKDVFVCPYAPHSLLFPVAEAVVHQGGVGTLAQALRAGRPQLVVPFFADQLDNAARAVRLGLAQSLRPARYSAAAAARALSQLAASADTLVCAHAVRARLGNEDGAAAAAAIILDRLEFRRQRDGVI